MEPQTKLITPAPAESHRARRRAGRGGQQDRRVIQMEFTVRADTRRLFHALTVPEYLETWLCLPGHNLGCSTAATRVQDDYLLEHYCGRSAAISISGSYLVCRRRNVVLSWSVEGAVRVPETRVDIRLRGDFENSTVILLHSGFGSSADYKWHEALWRASMSRLMRLYEPTDSLDSARL
jgi:uncharacterized protein YndB with AHSA1/START domain